MIQTCGHCGRTMGDMAGGFGSYNRVPLCHPNDPDRPDCYRNVAIYHHQVQDCSVCREGLRKEPDDHGYWVGNTFVLDPPTQIEDEHTHEVRTVRELDFSGMVLSDGITREDVVTAILNPVRAFVSEEDPDAVT